MGDMSSRPNWGLGELDFVFATLVVGAIINFACVWLLAPTAGAAAGGGSLVQRLLGDYYLKTWGAPGGWSSSVVGFSSSLLCSGGGLLLIAALLEGSVALLLDSCTQEWRAGAAGWCGPAVLRAAACG